MFDKFLSYHMFKRLNTGGELLSPQEIRNCTIRLLDNTFNEFLKKSAKDANFAVCMSQLSEEKRDKMYMEEYVLRFFALKNNAEAYEKDVGDFLTEYMEAISDPERTDVTFDYDAEEKSFRDTFRILKEALGEAAFSGVNKQGNPQGYFSALHFEALTIGIQKFRNLLTSANGSRMAQFRESLLDLKQDAQFQRLTKGGGRNYSAALRQRIQAVEKRVAACLK